MVGVSTKPGACDVCKGMEGIVFTEEPVRPHLNCRCRIEKHDKPPVEPRWTFDGSRFCLKNGKCWPAVSGPKGKGALPPGVYTITGNPVAVSDPKFCDKSGNCWWVPIEPDFDAGGRGSFGIHPDGGKPGTRGCIGLADSDTTDARDALGQHRDKKFMSNKVVSLFLILFLGFPSGVAAEDIDNVATDAWAFLEAVHGSQLLKDHYEFAGQGSEREELMIDPLCIKFGFEENSQACFEYYQCRFAAQDEVKSYYLVALSRILPRAKIERVVVEERPSDDYPYEVVHVTIAGKVLTCHRGVGEHARGAFGRFCPVRFDGRDLYKLPAPEIMEGPCRAILTGEKDR